MTKAQRKRLDEMVDAVTHDLDPAAVALRARLRGRIYEMDRNQTGNIETVRAEVRAVILRHPTAHIAWDRAEYVEGR